MSPARLARIRASRMRLASWTGTPSSERATAPASFRAWASVRASPRSPMDTAPMGHTRTPQHSPARSRTQRTCSGLSITGRVLGMQATEVKPPRAAAAVPLAMSSLYSKPGSRRWTCISTSPAQTVRPRASSTWASGALRSLPMTARRPSSMRRSITPPMPPTGSTRRPFWMRSFTSSLLSSRALGDRPLPRPHQSSVDMPCPGPGHRKRAYRRPLCSSDPF